VYSGIVLKNGMARGVDIEVKGETFQIKRTFEARPGEVKIKNAVVGLPLKDFFIKGVTIPPLDKKELSRAIQLQVSYHVPYDVSAAHAGWQIKKLQRDYGLLILATPRSSFYKPKAVIPEPLALYTLSVKKGLLLPEKNTLIVYIEGSEVITLSVEGLEIVFMRSFLKDEGLAAGLRLSAQAVYLRGERYLLNINRVVLFSDDEKDMEEVGKSIPAEINFIKTSDILKGNVPPQNKEKWLIPAGLALYASLFRKLKDWNVYKKESTARKSVMKGLTYSLPLWPLFLTAYYYADVVENRTALSGLKGRIVSLTQEYKDSIRFENEIGDLENLMKTGRDIRSPERWFNTIDAVNSSRPYGLGITNISGRTSGIVLLSGKAGAYDLVTEFMSKLQSTGRVEDITLIFTQSSEKEGVNFQISFRMKQ